MRNCDKILLKSKKCQAIFLTRENSRVNFQSKEIMALIVAGMTITFTFTNMNMLIFYISHGNKLAFYEPYEAQETII